MSSEEAKARIAALEKNPNHQRGRDPERADRETRDDTLPGAHARPTVPGDPRWQRTPEGYWDHPDHRKGDE